MEGTKIPSDITFMYRIGDVVPEGGGCAVGGDFVPVTSGSMFEGKRVIVFSLPGAYTPTCSTQQLPGFESMYEEFKDQGIDEIYCSSVNDGFVMNAWAKVINVFKVKLIPDGNGELCDSVGMWGDFTHLGFGKRSKRFAMIIDNGVVEKAFIEPDRSENDPDPYGESSPENIMAYLLAKTVG